MNARYYQPGTGRFLSQDSYTGNAYDPWTQHLYIYCGNNPTSMIDPTGFASAYSPFSSKQDPYERRKGESLSEMCIRDRCGEAHRRELSGWECKLSLLRKVG